MKQLLIAGTDTLLLMGKQLLNRGDITNEQFNEMQHRNNNLPSSFRGDISIKRG